MYDIEMHPYVAEDLAPRLAAAGYLIETAHVAEGATYENGSVQLPDLPISEQTLDALLSRFADFADNLLRSNGIEIPRPKLKSGLLDRLVQTDFLGLMVRPDRASVGPRTMSLKADPLATERPEDVERLHLDYLSARFLLDCNESNRADFDLIVAISSGALATEVVLSLQHPPGAGDDFEGLQVVLDGPLVMDALGLGQDGPVKYAKLLIDSIKRAKGTPVLFQHTIDEIEGAIRTPLENHERGLEVYGPLGRKLLKNSAFASYLRTILGKLPTLIANLEVPVLPFSDGDRATTRAFFTETQEDRLAASIGMYHLVDSKLRDARSVADILRIRGSARAKSIRDSGIIFVTRNNRLARLSRKFLIREGLAAREYFPPCITDRYLAGLLWITQGGGGTQLSRERLIANCTAAVIPRRDVVTKMHKFLSDTSPPMAARFEALMTNERAEHFLMDRTLADVTLITDKNLEQIYQDVETIAGERVAAEKDAVIADLETRHQAELEQNRDTWSAELDRISARSADQIREETTRSLELEAQLQQVRRRADDAERAAEQLQATESTRIVGLLKKCREAGLNAAKWARIRVAIVILGIAIVLGLSVHFVPAFIGSLSAQAVATVLLIVVGQAFSVLNYMVFPDAALAAYVKRRRDEAAFQRARDLDVEASFLDQKIDWRSH
jgi:VIT1/CCC1 family predicted Fe2+/Mn2+ transporter